MKPLRPRPPKEDRIVEAIRVALTSDGWSLVEKTHGNAFQAGWPDLFCYKRFQIKGRDFESVRWVEVKRPKQGKLTNAQKVRFEKWERAGLGVWVLSSPDELGLLEGKPNWRQWL